MGKISRSGYLNSLMRIRFLKFFDADPVPGSGIFFTRVPECKSSDPG